MQQLPCIEGPDDFRAVFDVSRETVEQLDLYVELLRKWQKAVNLVAKSTLDEIWTRHIGDSAQIVDILNKSDSSKKDGIWLDIGSGGGFPGLVAAIMLSEKADYSFHLVESNGRKCAFLSDVVRHLALPVDIHNERLEKMSSDSFQGSDGSSRVSIISARALASLDRLLTLSEPFGNEDLVAYYFKGREARLEIEQASQKWAFECEQHKSRTSLDGCILQISAVKRK